MRKTPAKLTESIFGIPQLFNQKRKAFEDYLQQGGNAVPLSMRMDVTLQISFCYTLTSMIPEAEKTLQECEAYIMQHGRPEQVACVYYLRGRINFDYARYEQAMPEAMESLHRFKALPFPYFVHNANVLCGSLCAKLNLFTEAINYMGEAHNIALQMNDRPKALTCLANLNDIRLQVYSAEDCIQYNLDLLEELKKEYGEKATPTFMGTYLQLAHLHLKLKKLKEASLYANHAYVMSEQLKDTFPPYFFLFTNLHGVKAEIAAQLGNEKEMVLHANECSRRGRLGNKAVPEADATLIMFRYYLAHNKPVKAQKMLAHVETILAPGEASPYYVEVMESKCAYYRAKNNPAEELKYFKLVYDYKMKTHQQALKHRNSYLSLLHDLEVKKAALEEQQTQLNLKTQELNMASYHLQQRTKLLTDLKEDITVLKRSKPKPEVIFKTLAKTIERALGNEENEKKNFREKFNETHREFITRLNAAYPKLSNTECRIAALLRSGFNTKEISNLLSADPRNIDNHRSSIRRKLNLKPGETLGLKLNAIA